MPRIGLISDTHGLLRPEAKTFLRGCDFIIHGGDIGGQHILSELAELAPVIAVRGNNDKESWAAKLQQDAFLQLGDIFIYVLHDLAELQIDPIAASVRVVVSGHSHAPLIKERDGVLFVNPGSSGPRRFKLPISIGELVIAGNSVSAQLIELEIPRAA
jgi:putative phosphoesterase